MTHFSESFRLVDESNEWTFFDLADGIPGFDVDDCRGSRISFARPTARALGAALCSLDGLAAEVRLMSPEAEIPEGFREISSTDGFFSIEGAVPIDGLGYESSTTWTLFTSGTTGEPKPISHTLRRLSGQHKQTESNVDLVWGMLYEPTRMAGIQMMIHCMTVGSCLVVPDRYGLISEKVSFFVSHGVTAVSATPTMWRQILQADDASQLNLVQATLGGEVADQKLLNAIRAMFPEARISHVYASTEIGAGFTVHDGREGFPAEFLERPIHGIQLAVDDGELLVSVAGDAAESFRTGDLVERVGDRVHFLGRKSGLVNVGGAKVAPEAVEILLREHDWVADAKVFAQANAFSGQILLAEVILTPSGRADDAPKTLRRWVKEMAPRHFVPASIMVVDHIDMNSAGKLVRK